MMQESTRSRGMLFLVLRGAFASSADERDRLSASNSNTHHFHDNGAGLINGEALEVPRLNHSMQTANNHLGHERWSTPIPNSTERSHERVLYREHAVRAELRRLAREQEVEQAAQENNAVQAELRRLAREQEAKQAAEENRARAVSLCRESTERSHEREFYQANAKQAELRLAREEATKADHRARAVPQQHTLPRSSWCKSAQPEGEREGAVRAEPRRLAREQETARGAEEERVRAELRRLAQEEVQGMTTGDARLVLAQDSFDRTTEC